MTQTCSMLEKVTRLRNILFENHMQDDHLEISAWFHVVCVSPTSKILKSHIGLTVCMQLRITRGMASCKQCGIKMPTLVLCKLCIIPEKVITPCSKQDKYKSVH